jgi:hypothetical protein
MMGFPGLPGSRSQDRPDLAKYGADAAGDARHYGASGDRDEAGHEGVFEEILAPAITPGPHEKNKGFSIDHLVPFEAALTATVYVMWI